MKKLFVSLLVFGLIFPGCARQSEPQTAASVDERAMPKATADYAMAADYEAAEFAAPAAGAIGGLAEDLPLLADPDQGRGAGDAGEQYDHIVDNPFVRVGDNPLSTFSIDVDTASYSKVRQYLVEYNQMPRPDAVRIEELLNYFQYDYAPPAASQSEPFATHVAVASCPWNDNHRLARVALKGRVIENAERPNSNLVLLLDTSGSMKRPNKLPLLKRGMQLLLKQLGENDRIAIVAYAGSAGIVLDSTPASDTKAIMTALTQLSAGGGTNGAGGLQLAYDLARSNFIENGTNRILLCTDGDFNLGQTSTDELVRMVEDQSKAGIELTVLGFGMGNLNDSMLEQISGKGNGNYAFIDTYNEAKKVLVQQLAGTLVTIAKDVKIQIEFNPSIVAGYRLIGYENRMLADQDFNDDKKDAGEIGAGHTVTALYEIVPTGADEAVLPTTDPLKYQEKAEPSIAAESGEMLTLKLRYKLPGEDTSQLMEHPVIDSGLAFDQTDQEFQFAAAVAGFGMLLRNSEHGGDWSFDTVSEVAQASMGVDPHGLREEFVDLVATAQLLAQEN